MTLQTDGTVGSSSCQYRTACRVRTAPETTQPNRTCTVYWSTGLTPVYLEGALERALSRVGVRSAAGASSFRATGRGQTACTHVARTDDRLGAENRQGESAPRAYTI